MKCNQLGNSINPVQSSTGGRNKAGQHSCDGLADAINHVTAHCRSPVTQIVCCATALSRPLRRAGRKPVGFAYRLPCPSVGTLRRLSSTAYALPWLNSVRCWSYNPAVSSAAPTIPSQIFHVARHSPRSISWTLCPSAESYTKR